MNHELVITAVCKMRYSDAKQHQNQMAFWLSQKQVEILIIPVGLMKVTDLNHGVVVCVAIMQFTRFKIFFIEYYMIFSKANYIKMNISTDPNDPLFKNAVFDHPMKPFGIQYWQSQYWYSQPYLRHLTVDQFLEENGGSPQACSWLRDQEYLVNINYHTEIGYLHLTPKIRFVDNKMANILLWTFKRSLNGHRYILGIHHPKMKLGQIKFVDLVIQLIQYQMRTVIKESVNAILVTSLPMLKIFVITARSHMFGKVPKKSVKRIKMKMNQINGLRIIVYLSFSAVPTRSLRYIKII